MFDTRNDLPAGTRTKVIELLNARLADAIDLGTQTKHAHWNVKGPNFIALHELFDKLAENVEEHIDTLAERVTALGGTAHGTIAAVAFAAVFYKVVQSGVVQSALTAIIQSALHTL